MGLLPILQEHYTGWLQMPELEIITGSFQLVGYIRVEFSLHIFLTYIR